MVKYFTKYVFIAAALALFAGPLLILSTPASAEDQSNLSRGGKLYDKWFKVIDADKPADTHSAWPASNTKKKGNVTHRCKSCHGWDGMGANGAYASGSYKTGIKGVNGMWGVPVADIIAVLKDDTHGFGSSAMEEEDYQDVALFVSKGMLDFSKYIDSTAKAAIGGNAGRGADYFNTICANCHRKDGSYPKDMGKTLSKQLSNPWEVMHKIMNGHPGAKMPALRALPNAEQIAVDLMAHIATLPKEK